MSDKDRLKVLFVDDESRVLDGLRRQFRVLRSEWDMRFVDSGAAALRELEREPADVVVTDMRMPGMTGSQLLLEVQKRWPSSARIILSGQTDQADLDAGLGAIHQFLQKPCDGDVLRAAIDSIREMTATLHCPELQRIVSGLTSLPVVTRVLGELTDALNDERAGSEEISRIVQRDIGLSAKIIQMANSAFFGLFRRVTTLTEAVTLLGAGGIRALAIANHLFERLGQDEACGPDIARLWSASVEIGGEAARASAEGGHPNSVRDQAMLAGMLSLVGRAAIAKGIPQKFAQARARSAASQIPLYAAEAIDCGAAQHVVGSFALRLWGFDESITQSVLHQVEPSAATGIGAGHPLPFVHAARCVVTHPGIAEALSPDEAFLGAFCISVPKPARRSAS